MIVIRYDWSQLSVYKQIISVGLALINAIYAFFDKLKSQLTSFIDCWENVDIRGIDM